MRFLEKSRSIQAIDSLCYDLEDSVTPGKKPEGRRNVLEILNRDRASGNYLFFSQILHPLKLTLPKASANKQSESTP
jgi:citrate lyase beta subunit